MSSVQFSSVQYIHIAVPRISRTSRLTSLKLHPPPPGKDTGLCKSSWCPRPGLPRPLPGESRRHRDTVACLPVPQLRSVVSQSKLRSTIFTNYESQHDIYVHFLKRKRRPPRHWPPAVGCPQPHATPRRPGGVSAVSAATGNLGPDLNAPPGPAALREQNGGDKP